MRWAKSVLCVAVLGLAGCGEEAVEYDAIGYIEADWTYVAPLEAGFLTALSIKQGDDVEEGQVIATLDADLQRATASEAEAGAMSAQATAEDLKAGARDTEIKSLEARLGQAKAERDLALAELKRHEPLIAEGFESPAVKDTLLARYNAAQEVVTQIEAELETARLGAREAAQRAASAQAVAATARVQAAQYRLDQRQLTAAISGRVEEVFFDVGEMVPTGRPIIALKGKDALKARFFVAEARLSELEVGQAILVKIDGREHAIEANVSYISSTAEFTPPVIYSKDVRDKMVFLVEATVPPDAQLHPGLPVEVCW